MKVEKWFRGETESVSFSIWSGRYGVAAVTPTAVMAA
jgi:hypothetical protein